MAKLIITLNVETDTTTVDPWELANELLDIHSTPDQNHSVGATFIDAEWNEA